MHVIDGPREGNIAKSMRPSQKVQSDVDLILSTQANAI